MTSCARGLLPSLVWVCGAQPEERGLAAAREHRCPAYIFVAANALSWFASPALIVGALGFLLLLLLTHICLVV
jgi:hypothetical protein